MRIVHGYGHWNVHDGFTWWVQLLAFDTSDYIDVHWFRVVVVPRTLLDSGNGYEEIAIPYGVHRMGAGSNYLHTYEVFYRIGTTTFTLTSNDTDVVASTDR